MKERTETLLFKLAAILSDEQRKSLLEELTFRRTCLRDELEETEALLETLGGERKEVVENIPPAAIPGELVNQVINLEPSPRQEKERGEKKARRKYRRILKNEGLSKINLREEIIKVLQKNTHPMKLAEIANFITSPHKVYKGRDYDILQSRIASQLFNMHRQQAVDRVKDDGKFIYVLKSAAPQL